ncbi:MAG: glycosyltransferase [Rhizomicrobium sp.]
MIFVTVGSSEPFDRLIQTIDLWAGSRDRTDVFAQIGRSSFVARHIQTVQFMSPSEFRERVQAARIIIAHAGMGTIISALEVGRPILVLPRREHLGETRSDHQLATAGQFARMEGVVVAKDEADLVEKLDNLEVLEKKVMTWREASPELISAIREFILGTESSAGPVQAGKRPR